MRSVRYHITLQVQGLSPLQSCCLTNLAQNVICRRVTVVTSFSKGKYNLLWALTVLNVKMA